VQARAVTLAVIRSSPASIALEEGRGGAGRGGTGGGGGERLLLHARGRRQRRKDIPRAGHIGRHQNTGCYSEVNIKRHVNSLMTPFDACFAEVIIIIDPLLSFFTIVFSEMIIVRNQRNT